MNFVYYVVKFSDMEIFIIMFGGILKFFIKVIIGVISME